MKVEPAGTLVGHIAVPGDKSISHRAVLIGSEDEAERAGAILEAQGYHAVISPVLE